ncbi:hypothetical protein, partial [Paraburkholderia humisilvae]|uniref:hypothetical protein n=1 Tax=Paraburkholderia humisilvae TaxID=627669 RepID=UPI0035E63C94
DKIGSLIASAIPLKNSRILSERMRPPLIAMPQTAFGGQKTIQALRNMIAKALRLILRHSLFLSQQHNSSDRFGQTRFE